MVLAPLGPAEAGEEGLGLIGAVAVADIAGSADRLSFAPIYGPAASALLARA